MSRSQPRTPSVPTLRRFGWNVSVNCPKMSAFDERSALCSGRQGRSDAAGSESDVRSSDSPVREVHVSQTANLLHPLRPLRRSMLDPDGLYRLISVLLMTAGALAVILAAVLS